ncbi:aldo/keto reductase [Marinovum sp. SP66]|jgi:predicted oxidoreductase|uniref:aldo/keto reductase n=1 Tax=Marinovum TaxID=367771 RepID=UPI00237B9232|nr:MULTISPECIES: aldo/keto reductase [unclassified Marinovum]MDD9739549.1 aldo/keto reductase [Marinovum sp. SP66]MDD9745431.1 aldo/keto reductase [Marinovum sp. PR37]
MQRVSLSGQMEMSRLVYGMWRVADDADTSPGHVQAKLEACLEQGITTVDQADIYGDYGAEEVLGAALKAAPGLRDRIEIVTKCDIIAPIGKYSDRRVKYYDTSAAHITASVEASLANMATDHIDLLLIHRPDPFMDHHETGGALDGLVASGKVRHVGVSNFRLNDWTLLQSAMTVPLVTNQIEASVLCPAPFLEGEIAWMQERGIHPMAWSPLAGGQLFSDAGKTMRRLLERIAGEQGADVSAVAVAWLLAHPAGLLPVLGTNNLDRIRALSRATEIEIDRETWFEILTAAMGKEVP